MPAFSESENEEAMSDAIDSYLLSCSRLSILISLQIECVSMFASLLQPIIMRHLLFSVYAH